MLVTLQFNFKQLATSLLPKSSKSSDMPLKDARGATCIDIDYLKEKMFKIHS